MPARISALAVAVGVVVAAAVVIGSLATAATPRTTERFDGVAINITYLSGSSSIFGPASQNACDQTFPPGPGSPGFGPSCPTELIGGTSYNFAIFVTGNPGTWPGLWVNLSVSAPFNFTVNPWTAASNPTVPSHVNGLFEGGGDQLFDAGNWWSWNLVFTFPQTYASHPGGLWLHATLTVQPTNQTYGR